MAIKNYRMALDQTAVVNMELRNKITKNRAVAFLKMGQYKDAVDNFETVATTSNNMDKETAYNMILCYYALGEAKEIKRSFKRLLGVQIMGMDSDRDLDEESEIRSSFHDLQDYLKDK